MSIAPLKDAPGAGAASGTGVGVAAGGDVGVGGGAGVPQAEIITASRAKTLNAARAIFFTSFPPLLYARQSDLPDSSQRRLSLRQPPPFYAMRLSNHGPTNHQYTQPMPQRAAR
jgi:hypothetical protein